MPLRTTIALLALLTPLIVAAEPEHPNVLMISVDDLNDWTGYLAGHPDVKTPHLDRLAARSRVFTNAHCAVPVCSSSRVSVMSGIAATTHGSYEIGPAYEEIPALKDIPTIQRYFKDHGYTTYAGGKVLHHGFRSPLDKDIDVHFKARKGGGPRPKGRMNWPGGAWDWGQFPETDAEMYDRQLADEAAAALSEKHERPFFMSVGFFRPHVPLFAPEKWFTEYDRESIALAASPEEDLKDLPPNFLSINEYAIAPTHASVVEQGVQRGMTHAYLACISFVDHCIGVVLDGLDNGPARDNTIIVLWSDHGFHLGEKHHWAKRTLWEESTRVPFLIAGPGIEPGEPCREPASLIDIYPTLTKLCNLPTPGHTEGQSLLPQLEDPLTAREEPAIISSYFGNHAVRTRDWRYIRYDDGAEELYNHQTDPIEFTNLASEPEFAAKKAELAKWLPKNPAPEVKPVSERAKGGAKARVTK